MKSIKVSPLTAKDFESFGDVLDAEGTPDKIINQGLCGRYHDRAALEFTDGRAGVSLFKARIRTLPYKLEMMERHPEGSQLFIPMSETSFLVIVAHDQDGKPGEPYAFESQPGQAVNYHRGTWHGVLTPLYEPGLFAVVDRIGPGANLDEHWFDAPYEVTRA